MSIFLLLLVLPLLSEALEVLLEPLLLFPLLPVLLELVCEDPETELLPCAKPRVVNSMAAQRTATSRYARLRIIERSPSEKIPGQIGYQVLTAKNAKGNG